MRRIALRCLGLALGLAALSAATPKSGAAQVCTLLCTRGFHCCIASTGPVCVPPFQPCQTVG